MTRPAKPSHVHHFTPRSVLRRFSLGGLGDQVMVFDKTSGRSWSAGLTSAGSGKGYNTLVQPDGTRLNFEPDFDDIDKTYARLGNRLAQTRTVAGWTVEDRTDLADVAAAQFLRTPIVRTTLTAIPRTLADGLRARGFEALSEQDLPDDNAARRIARELVQERARIRDALATKDLMLFEPTESLSFWTSDHPVVRHSNTPLGQLGVESLGVEIYLPIACDLMLGFLCPSLLKTLLRRPLEQLVMPEDKRARLIAQRQALLEGMPLAASDGDVRWFNSCQVSGSARFLYAATDDFALARTMLEDHPDLRGGEPMVSMSGLGEGPPRPRNLPPGEWLCLEGTDRWTRIPITNWNRDDDRAMSTVEPELLAEALDFAPFTTAHVITDEGEEMMRDVTLEVIETGPPTRFRLVFADPSMRALDRLIDRRRSP